MDRAYVCTLYCKILWRWLVREEMFLGTVFDSNIVLTSTCTLSVKLASEKERLGSYVRHLLQLMLWSMHAYGSHV